MFSRAIKFKIDSVSDRVERVEDIILCGFFCEECGIFKHKNERYLDIDRPWLVRNVCKDCMPKKKLIDEAVAIAAKYPEDVIEWHKSRLKD